MGAESPLSVKHGELSELITFYFGRDGFGDTNIERPSLQNLPKKSAVVHIVDTVREYPGTSAIGLFSLSAEDLNPRNLLCLMINCVLNTCMIRKSHNAFISP